METKTIYFLQQVRILINNVFENASYHKVKQTDYSFGEKKKGALTIAIMEMRERT